jgi:stearoyl-CoA desaturase (Delta-9 desaturase)
MRFDFKIVFFLFCIHTFSLFGIPYFQRTHLPFIIFLWAMKCIGITSGMHRLWTHASYKTNKFIKLILLTICNSTFEASVQEWTINHRMHHRFEESNPELDPYSIKGGFLWAHIIANCIYKSEQYNKEADKIKLELELERSDFDNKIIRFEHKYNFGSSLFTGIILPFSVLKLYTGDTGLSCLYSVVLSILSTHHCTWSINSFAHWMGDKPFVTKHTSGNSHLLSLFTFGEGYHNFHHAYPKDYRASHTLFGCNVTGWIITIMHKLGLAYDLNVVKDMKQTPLPQLDDVEYKTL